MIRYYFMPHAYVRVMKKIGIYVHATYKFLRLPKGKTFKFLQIGIDYRHIFRDYKINVKFRRQDKDSHGLIKAGIMKRLALINYKLLKKIVITWIDGYFAHAYASINTTNFPD